VPLARGAAQCSGALVATDVVDGGVTSETELLDPPPPPPQAANMASTKNEVSFFNFFPLIINHRDLTIQPTDFHSFIIAEQQ